MILELDQTFPSTIYRALTGARPTPHDVHGTIHRHVSQARVRTLKFAYAIPAVHKLRLASPQTSHVTAPSVAALRRPGKLWNACCASGRSRSSCLPGFSSRFASVRRNTHIQSLSFTTYSLTLHAPLFCALALRETLQFPPATTLYLLSGRVPGGLALGFSSPPPRVDLRPLAAAGQTNHHRLLQRL